MGFECSKHGQLTNRNFRFLLDLLDRPLLEDGQLRTCPYHLGVTDTSHSRGGRFLIILWHDMLRCSLIHPSSFTSRALLRRRLEVLVRGVLVAVHLHARRVLLLRTRCLVNLDEALENKSE